MLWYLLAKIDILPQADCDIADYLKGVFMQPRRTRFLSMIKRLATVMQLLVFYTLDSALVFDVNAYGSK